MLHEDMLYLVGETATWCQYNKFHCLCASENASTTDIINNNMYIYMYALAIKDKTIQLS